MTWEVIRHAKIGQMTDRTLLGRDLQAVYGGLAWPGKRPGFCVVVGMSRERASDGHAIILLDEAEAVGARELVKRLEVLDFKYGVARWIGDYSNQAGSAFLWEMNDRRKAHPVQTDSWPRRDPEIHLHYSPIVEMDEPYAYMLPELKRLLDPDRRQLFLKDSRIVQSLTEIKPDEMHQMRLGDYPAIEALAMAVLALREDIARGELGEIVTGWSGGPRGEGENYDPLTDGL